MYSEWVKVDFKHFAIEVHIWCSPKDSPSAKLKRAKKLLNGDREKVEVRWCDNQPAGNSATPLRFAQLDV